MKSLDDKKKEALDIFSDEGKKKNSQIKKGTGKPVVAPISKKLDAGKQEDAEFAKAEASAKAEAAAEEQKAS